MIPNNLTQEQKNCRKNTRSDIMKRLKKEPGLLINDITFDKTGFTGVTSKQIANWCTGRPYVFKNEKSSNEQAQTEGNVY